MNPEPYQHCCNAAELCYIVVRVFDAPEMLMQKCCSGDAVAAILQPAMVHCSWIDIRSLLFICLFICCKELLQQHLNCVNL